MIHPEIFFHTFQEELYDVPVRPVVALPISWQDIRESDKELLEKILSLAKITFNHIKVISTNKLDILQWKERPEKVIAFGIEMPGFSQHEVIEIQDIKLIVTLGLPELETADKEVKQKLTASIQQMFLS